MSEQDYSREELVSARDLLEEIVQDRPGKALITAWAVGLGVIGFLLLGLAGVLLTYNIQIGLWSSASLNLGANLVGSAIIVLAIQLVTWSMERDQASRAKVGIMVGLAAFGVIFLLTAFAFGRYLAPAGSSEFVVGLFLNLGTELIGAAVLFFLLEQVVEYFQMREEREQEVLKKLAAFIERGGSEAIPARAAAGLEVQQQIQRLTVENQRLGKEVEALTLSVDRYTAVDAQVIGALFGLGVAVHPARVVELLSPEVDTGRVTRAEILAAIVSLADQGRIGRYGSGKVFYTSVQG